MGRPLPAKGGSCLRQHPQQEEAEGQEKPKCQLPQYGAASSCARWHQVEKEQEEEEEEEDEACQLAGLHSGQEGRQAEEEQQSQTRRAISSMPLQCASG